MDALFTGMPISGTNTFIRALILARIVGLNMTNDIGWKKL